MKMYDKDFYEINIPGSTNSAKKIVPYVIDVLRPNEINSVVDFGCGVGGWLAEFRNLGCDDVLGLDFGEAEASQILIPQNFLQKRDLSQEIRLEKQYDLCISLEVAEHIDEKCADNFIDNLCRASDIVMFSAAIRGQGGMGHVNEQRISYWIKKFEERGFRAYDVIRPKFWDDKEIEIWYRANTMMYVNTSRWLEPCSMLNCSSQIVDFAHPDLVFDLQNKHIQYTENHIINKNFFRKHCPNIYNWVRRLYHSGD